MKSKIFVWLFLVFVALQASAECTIYLSVLHIPQRPEIPQASVDYFSQRLQSICSRFSFDIDGSASRFFIAGKFVSAYTNTMPGPPEQTAVRTTLTLYIGDLEAQKVFSTLDIELRGAGTSQQRAYISALGPISADNIRIQSFLEDARKRIINYYDETFPLIKQQVRQAIQRYDYQQALWLLSLIPSCSLAYPEAIDMAIPLINKDINRQGELLLLAAKTYWASSPNKNGAEKAMECIRQIDPASSSFVASQSFIDEIKARNISDLDFETRHKFETDVEIRNLTLDVIKAIGVAYGKGQKYSISMYDFISHL